MKKQILWTLPLLMVTVLACTKKTETAPPPPAATTEQPVTATTTTTAREIALHVEVVDGAPHWLPGTIDVTAGETVKFVVSHDLKDGPDFHGFTIAVLNIAKQINRGQTETFEVTIPAALQAGEYPVTCQFHPKHVAAKLVVKQAG